MGEINMIDDKTRSILKIADVHVKTLQETLEDMAPYYKFSQEFIIGMNKNHLRTLETMASRFGKLKDLIGTKIIDIYLQSQSQPIEGLSIIDKIHKLEKFNMIDSEDTWLELRNVRNHITQEYPDEPALTAKHLNNIYRLASVLISIYQKLSSAIQYNL